MNPYSNKFRANWKRTAGGKRARVEIIPLIDVMFLLVAFFVIVSISMVQQKGIFVELSPAKTGDESSEDPKAVTVSVDAESQLYLGKEQLSKDLLLERLAEVATNNRDTTVIINADKEAKHEAVIAALDIVRRSMLQNVVFSVEPMK